MSARPIKLHIGTLVLDGVHANGSDVARAVEQELARRLAAHGVPAGWENGGAQHALKGGAIQLGSRPTARAAGKAIASSVLGAKR